MQVNPRHLAFLALKDIYRQQSYTDIALDRVLRQSQLTQVDKGFVCELVYGVVRRVRTLDALIDMLGKKTANSQPPDLRIVLQLGLYQLRYLERIPAAAAVNTSVELAKAVKLEGLAKVVNGLLRKYLRLSENGEPLQLPIDPIPHLGILHSFPDWIVELFIEQLGVEVTDKLCQWFNQSPCLDLRVNSHLTSLEEVEAAFLVRGISVSRITNLPQGLRLNGSFGSIQALPGFERGWWMVQDSSAQLVTHLLNPEPGAIIIDACAAPGGKTTHIAELMQDTGTIWACDVDEKRLKKVKENSDRLQLQSIQIIAGDSRNFPRFKGIADGVLLDAPCSGLGTLHKRADLRWRQSPEKIQELCLLQKELLQETQSWVKPGGSLVYSTCTLNKLENEEIIKSFLWDHSDWQIEPPSPDSLVFPFAASEGWLKILPQVYFMDGFFMVRLRKK